MTTLTAHPPQSPSRSLGRMLAIAPGQPDPRPVTDYSVDYSYDGSITKLTVTLAQPCVIREPRWALLDVGGGEPFPTEGVNIDSPTSFSFFFDGAIPESLCFLQAPYQDTQVQNFQGGFVRPGATWFRAPK